MTFKETIWAYSNETATPSVEEGPRNLLIKSATFDNSEKRYTITFEDLALEIPFTVSYKLNKADADGNIIPNPLTRDTLISLGTALAGRPIGIPNPTDIVGGVVVGNVRIKGRYINIYTYDSVSENLAAFSEIEQYFEVSEGN